MTKSVAKLAATFAIAASTLAACGPLTTPYEVGRERIASKMLEPDAVQWRNVHACGADARYFVAEMNTKNAYGAYTGFRQVIAHKEGSETDIPEGISEAFDAAAREHMSIHCYGQKIVEKADAMEMEGVDDPEMRAMLEGIVKPEGYEFALEIRDRYCPLNRVDEAT